MSEEVDLDSLELGDKVEILTGGGFYYLQYVGTTGDTHNFTSYTEDNKIRQVDVRQEADVLTYLEEDGPQSGEVASRPPRRVAHLDREKCLEAMYSAVGCEPFKKREPYWRKGQAIFGLERVTEPSPNIEKTETLCADCQTDGSVTVSTHTYIENTENGRVIQNTGGGIGNYFGDDK